MKVEFVVTKSNPSSVTVVAEGSSEEVDAFVEWLDLVEIDSTSYAEYFTGIPFRARSGVQTFWCYLDDPHEEQRILIKLRWQCPRGNDGG